MLPSHTTSLRTSLIYRLKYVDTKMNAAFFHGISLLCVVSSAVNCTEGSIRLVVGDSYDYYLDRVMGEDVEYIDDRLSQGRVEMCVNGDYGTICADGGQWSFNESAVVCRELGFTAAGKLMDLIKRNCTRWFGLTFLTAGVHCAC